MTVFLHPADVTPKRQDEQSNFSHSEKLNGWNEQAVYKVKGYLLFALACEEARTLIECVRELESVIVKPCNRTDWNVTDN
jgi:hypothetical protein